MGIFLGQESLAMGFLQAYDLLSSGILHDTKLFQPFWGLSKSYFRNGVQHYLSTPPPPKKKKPLFFFREMEGRSSADGFHKREMGVVLLV